MLKKVFPALAVMLLALLLSAPGFACVGRTLYVGALDTTEDKVLAQMLVLLINERTGTTVKIRFFDTEEALYRALREDDEEKRADIIVENSRDALALLKKPDPGDLGPGGRRCSDVIGRRRHRPAAADRCTAVFRYPRADAPGPSGLRHHPA